MATPQLTSQWVGSFESRMRRVVSNQYQRLAQSRFLNWPKFMKRISDFDTRRLIVTWVIDSSTIQAAGMRGGLQHYEEIGTWLHEYETQHWTSALKLTRDELLDKDANGLQIAREWSRMKGAEFAYWPQHLGVGALLQGETLTCYDTHPYFDTDHPLDPNDSSVGSYANLLTSTSSGLYPGACPIDDSVSLNVAVQNLAKVFAYINQQKMANGIYPRFLEGYEILYPSPMKYRVNQLLSAQYIAQVAQIAAALNGGTAATGVGTGDGNQAALSALGVEGATEIRELTTSPWSNVAGAGTDKTSWYVTTKQLGEEELGGIVYAEREPFYIRYYTGVDGDADGLNVILARANELEWLQDGRNEVGYGHPYLIYKVKAA